MFSLTLKQNNRELMLCKGILLHNINSKLIFTIQDSHHCLYQDDLFTSVLHSIQTRAWNNYCIFTTLSRIHHFLSINHWKPDYSSFYGS